MIRIDAPHSPPTWALLQQELIKANVAACRRYYDKYFDGRGYLLCVERWGADDWPDDAIESVNDWPQLHALSGSDEVCRMYSDAWEGHLRQYTLARSTAVPFARDGMYYKEFPCMFDWQHNAEGLSVFNLQGLSGQLTSAFRGRVIRYAGFYMGEDSGAQNFDPEHRIIRSLFNGSRGPLLRQATALDWAGDPIEVKNRFRLVHGEESYDQMLEHFEEYTDIVGDHPLNLLTTTLHLNAYMLTGELQYRQWLLDYVDAWQARMHENGGLIPSNIGLDGRIGGECGWKWYGGTYGWGFSVTVPQTGAVAHRNRVGRGFVGFMNAYLLTGNDRYLDGWRQQLRLVNAQCKKARRAWMYPRMYGDDGWYAYEPTPWSENALEIYFLSLREEDRQPLQADPWLQYLDGKRPGYAEECLRRDLERVRTQAQEMEADTTTRDTRLADDPMALNPVSVGSLIKLAWGGLHVKQKGAVQFSSLHYYDPLRRRCGLPPDVSALVCGLTADEVQVFLVNTNQVEGRRLLLQGGAYSEHQILEATWAGQPAPVVVDDNICEVHLAPGAGERLALKTRRFANQPTLLLPWDRVSPGRSSADEALQVPTAPEFGVHDTAGSH